MGVSQKILKVRQPKIISTQFFLAEDFDVIFSLPFSINFTSQIENQVSDYRLTRTSSLYLLILLNCKNMYKV
jgi:hypothetical protein